VDMLTGCVVTFLVVLVWNWLPWRLFTRGWGLGTGGHVLGVGLAWMGGWLIAGDGFWNAIVLWGSVGLAFVVCVVIDKLGGLFHFNQIKTLRGASLIKEHNGERYANTNHSRERAGADGGG